MESFKLVRDALAKIIRNSEWKDKARGVVFYYKYDKPDDIKVLVLPLFEEYIFPSSNYKDVNNNEIENIKKIAYSSEGRSSADIFHAEHFKEKHFKEGHFIIDIKKNNVITYDVNNINDLKAKNYTENNNEPNISVSVIEKINEFDQYYFDSGCKKLLLVPIPLLSTPAVVLALDFKRLNGEGGDTWKDFVHFIYNHTSGTINFHIYNNLMKKLNDVDASNETELIYKYAQTLAEIMLPIDYKVHKVKSVVKTLKEALSNEQNQTQQQINADKTTYNQAAKLSWLFYECHHDKDKKICDKEAQSCNNCKGRKNRNGEYEIVLTEPVKSPHSKPREYNNSLWPRPVDDSYLEGSDTHANLKSLSDAKKKEIEININKYDYQFKFDLTLTLGNQENNVNKGQEFLLLFDETSYMVPDPANRSEFIWVWGLPDYATNSDQLRLMLQNIFNVIYMQWLAKRKIREHSVRSAIAAIMARNISHNLGSHVLAYLRTQLSDVQTLIKSNSLRDIISQQENLQNVIEKLQRIINGATEVDDQLKKIELPFLVGLGHLLNYIQERQDFIATISTNHIPYSAPINFKDIIYDELNHDYKAIRHHESLGFKFNQGDNLLLEHIAHSEGYKRKHISIWFREFNGLNEKAREENKNKAYDLASAEEAFNRLNEIEVILPGGAVGRQAFFSIIENFIRNSAKHADKVSKGEPNLEVHIDIIDIANENEIKRSKLQTYEIMNADQKKYGEILDDSKMTDFFRVELSDNISDFEKAKTTLLDALSDDYILEDGSLKEDYKGIKEMRISATWLRFLNDEHILEHENGNGDPTKKYPPVLQLANKNGKMCYVFYLLKPKELLFVTDTEYLLNKYDEEWKSEFEKIGWKITSFENFDKKNDPRYRLIVFNCDENNTDYHKLIKICHSRVIADDKIAVHLKELFEGELMAIDIFNKFYRTIIDKRICNNATIEVPILIGDPQTDSKLEKCYKYIQIASSASTNNLNIIFKAHLETAANLKEFEDKYIKVPLDIENIDSKSERQNCLFVESITGNNSTDRLIRKGNYDERWYLNMLESALTNVIVIDERLWGYYTGIDESDLNRKSTIVILRDKIKELNSFDKLNKAQKKDELRKFLKDTKVIFMPKGAAIIEDERKLINQVLGDMLSGNDIEEIFERNRIELTAEKRKTAHPNNYKFLMYKNVWVFNIVKIENQHALYDTKPDPDNDDLPIKIAEITPGDNSSFLKPIDKGEEINRIELPDKKHIHFICVHQGLIDKLYNSIKDDMTDKATAKKEIINTIKDSLGGENTRIVIHSGRSRPPESDLPKDFTFLQYSAISHAIKDCKHSLTELLYSARL